MNTTKAPARSLAEAASEEQPAEGLDPRTLSSCWVGDTRGIPGSFSFGDDVRPWNWLELDANAAGNVWTFLVGFVSFLNARYGEQVDKRIPPCWPEHGGLAEEITTLAFARWQAFGSVHATIGGAQYWHSYTLPGFYSRMKQWLGSDALRCQQGCHRPCNEAPGMEEATSYVRTEAIVEADIRSREGSAEGDAHQGTHVTDARPSVSIPFLNQKPDATRKEAAHEFDSQEPAVPGDPTTDALE